MPRPEPNSLAHVKLCAAVWEQAMPVYLVEEMRGDRVIRSRKIEATTPRSAASISTGRKLTSQRWGRDWVRVTDELRGNIFAYCFAEADLEPQRVVTPRQVQS